MLDFLFSDGFLAPGAMAMISLSRVVFLGEFDVAAKEDLGRKITRRWGSPTELQTG